jgi:sugar lactone lactonase YvrE
MKLYQAEIAFTCEADVGEGPIWNSETEELIWVDVTGGKLFFYNPKTNQQEIHSLDKHVGAIALTNSAQYLLAIRDGFATYDRASGNYAYLVKVLDREDTRFNDGKIDPRGRFLAGTLKYQPSPGTASLFSLENNKFKTLLSNVGLSNGMCWNNSGDQLFYIDSLTQSIQAFEYDLDSGDIGEARVIINFDAAQGTPDGMTIDAAGNLWVAMWAGGKVLNISQSGEIIGEIIVPVDQVTSVAFGGIDLSTLYITTARYLMSEPQLQEQPLAGSLFKANVGVSGLLENRYLMANKGSDTHV